MRGWGVWVGGRESGGWLARPSLPPPPTQPLFVPLLQHNSIAKFLEAKGFVEEALGVATDPGGRRGRGGGAGAAGGAGRQPTRMHPPRLPTHPPPHSMQTFVLSWRCSWGSWIWRWSWQRNRTPNPSGASWASLRWRAGRCAARGQAGGSGGVGGWGARRRAGPEKRAAQFPPRHPSHPSPTHALLSWTWRASASHAPRTWAACCCCTPPTPTRGACESWPRW